MGLNLFTPDSEMTPQALNGYRTSWIFLIGAGLTLPFYVYIISQSQGWQLYVAPAVTLLVVAGAVASIRLCRQNRVEPAMWLLIGVLVVAGILSSVVYDGLGLLIGLIVFAFLLQISTQAMPVRLISWMLLIAIVAGGSMAILDLLPLPLQQYDASSIQFVAVIATVVVIMVQGFIIGRQFLSYPLGIKLTLSFLTVSLISIGTLAIASYIIVSTALVESANRTLSAAASQVAADIDNFITLNKDAVRVESQLPALAAYLSLSPEQRVNSPEEEEALAILRALKGKSLTILSYALLDVQGKNVLDTNTPNIGKYNLLQPYFLEPIQTKLPYVSEVQFSLNTLEPASLYFSNAVNDNAGQALGVLVVQYNATVIQRLVSSSGDDDANEGVVGEESFVIVLDENHLRLADGDDPGLQYKFVVPQSADVIADLQAEGRLPLRPPEALSTNLPDFEASLRDLSEGAANFITATHPDEEADSEQGAVVSMENRPWLVVVVQPRSIFLQPVAEQTRTTLIVALGVTAVVVAAALVVAQMLAGPITRLTAVAQQVAAGDLRAQSPVESNDEIGTLATTFNNMTTQLADLVGSLEERVAARTKALTTSVEVSRSLSTILNQKQLVFEVVEQVRAAFNYSHTQIYLLSESQQELLMVGGTGQAGAIMLANRHKIAWGKGLVGRAAATNAAILVGDVKQDPGWLPNALLPDTKAEIAIPIATGDKILGVLDVQHNITGGLTQEDVDLLQSIANQVAIALQNARLLEDVQQRAEHEALVNTINQKIQRATTVENVIQIASEELGKAMNTQSSTVQIGLKTSGSNHSTH